MSKIVLPTVASADRLTTINDNFQKVEDALNSNVLYRDNIPGEPNSMSDDLDMNSRRVYNLPVPTLDHEAARLVDVQNAVTGAKTANLVVVTPAGTISSTNVQAALQELDGDVQAVESNLQAHINDTDAAHSSSAVSFIAAGAGATTRTMQDKGREIISVLDSGTPTGINDDALVAAAFTAAAGKHLHFPAGTYAISNLVWPADTLFTGEGVSSIIKKRANGDIGTLGGRSLIRDLYFDLQGATYTGRCFVIDTGAQDALSWRRWENCYFMDSYSHAIEFTASLSGYMSSASDCVFTMSGPAPLATAAIKLPSVNETNGNRHFTNCKSGSFILIDFAGGENTNLVGCLMGPPLYSSLAQKSCIVGGRIVARGDGSVWTIDGSETVIIGNTIAQLLVTLSTTLDEAFIDGNSWAATTFTDNATGDANDNKIYLPSFSYAPVWTGSVSDPAIGNGQLFGSYTRRGEDCRVRITLAVGSTTTFGSGFFKFTLPYTPADIVTGSAVLLDVSTGFPYALPSIAPSAAVNSVSLVVSGVGFCTGTSPVALANGDVIYIDLDYRIA